METEFILALKNHLFFNVDVRSIYLVPNLIDENVKNNQMHVHLTLLYEVHFGEGIVLNNDNISAIKMTFSLLLLQIIIQVVLNVSIITSLNLSYLSLGTADE